MLMFAHLILMCFQSGFTCKEQFVVFNWKAVISWYGFIPEAMGLGLRLTEFGIEIGVLLIQGLCAPVGFAIVKPTRVELWI